MKLSRFSKLLLVLVVLLLIYSIFTGDPEDEGYAIAIIKEEYSTAQNPLSRALQGGLTVAFNNFFSQVELRIPLHLEFITYESGADNLEEKTG